MTDTKRSAKTALKTAVIIPSRYSSQRLPQKPLAMLRGKSLVQRVYEKAKAADNIDIVIVATDHEEIAEHVQSFGGEVIMTSPECPSGTDRVAEAAAALSEEYGIVINVQGDEPLIAPQVISKLALAMQEDYTVDVATPISPILHAEELQNPATVKVVRDTEGNALYFSRQAIPFLRDVEQISSAWLNQFQYMKHIGLYAFRRPVLEQFVTLPEGLLERAEKLEQLRLLEAGIKIKCVTVQYDSVAVDTPDDIIRVEALLDRTENG